VEVLCWCGIRWDAVGNWGGALLLSALTDLTTVTVMGRQRQVRVEVSFAKMDRSVGVFKHLKEEEEVFLLAASVFFLTLGYELLTHCKAFAHTLNL